MGKQPVFSQAVPFYFAGAESLQAYFSSILDKNKASPEKSHWVYYDIFERKGQQNPKGS
ncbi:hypothetical protein [Acidaminobacterium chupaoyuni]